jgi:D-xylose transport system ATP-binding protein
MLDTTTKKTPLIQMTDIDKQFGGVHAVQGVSVDLNPGEVVGVLGHNGAGKSCLMRMLSGAMTLSGGQINVNGSPVDFKSDRKSVV